MSADPFAPATIAGSWLRLALMGPTGSGKTLTALRIASGMVDALGGGKIAVIDTEHGKSRLYARRFAFNVIELPSFEPERYIDNIDKAVEYGYTVLIIDSISHAWAGRGGILATVDEIKATARNKWTEPWGSQTPRHQELFESILRAPIHVIVTMRSKMEYVQQGEGPQAKVIKVGMAPIQRDGVEYEFDIDGELDVQNNLEIWKSRYEAIPQGLTIHQAGEDLGRQIVEALTVEGEPPPAPPEMTAPPPRIRQKPSAGALSEMNVQQFGEWFWAEAKTAGIDKTAIEGRLEKPIKACSRQDMVDALWSLMGQHSEPDPDGITREPVTS